jgi:hypothetical protein
MATITFRQHVQTVKYITVEIPDVELFKEKAKEFVEQEGTLNFWNLEDEFIDYCDVYFDSVDDEEDNDELYKEFDELGIIWNDEQLLADSE